MLNNGGTTLSIDIPSNNIVSEGAMFTVKDHRLSSRGRGTGGVGSGSLVRSRDGSKGWHRARNIVRGSGTMGGHSKVLYSSEQGRF